MPQLLFPAGPGRRDRASCTSSWGMAEVTIFPIPSSFPLLPVTPAGILLPLPLHWPCFQPLVKNCLHHLGLLC